MRQKIKFVILLLIGAQIIVMVTSYGLLIHNLTLLEHNRNTHDLLGQLELTVNRIYIDTNEFLNGNTYYDPILSMDKFEQYLITVRQGGTFDKSTVSSLAEKFLYEYEILERQFSKYKNVVSDTIKKSKNGESINQEDFKKINNAGRELSSALDFMDSNLRKYNYEQTQNFLGLQLNILIMNITVLGVLVYLILRILSLEVKKNNEIMKLSAIGELSARLAHDLRNPLSVIKSTFDIIKLQNPNPSTKTQEQINRIDRAIDRISHQIEGVLGFVRSKPPEKELVNISELLSEVLSDLRIPKDITIKKSVNDAIINCDYRQMEVVFTNLIKNALQATNGRGIIRINCIESQNDIKLTFENSGQPIPVEHLEHIFTPLFTTKQEGTGLGLTTCKNIIENHGGRITVKNHPTTFTVILPK